jgi:peptidoglycan/LPS O-acetylase OafA/YrhL
MPGTARELEQGRVRSLDGLRGLAAVVVLEHHALLASVPWLAGPYAIGPLPARGSLDWLLTYTPLHIFWAGPEFVVVFFVLSGFVLSLPVARGGRLRVSSYYPARLMRLYLPVWGALAVAAALHVAVSHSVMPGATWWLNAHAEALQMRALRFDALLERKAGDWGFTSVLWSLHWEVLFSLLLPALLLLAARLRSWSALAAALCFVALLEHNSGGRVTDEYLLELPPFLLGMGLAFHHERLAALAERLRERSAANVALGLALGLACVCGLTADWWLPAGIQTAPLVAAGACLALVAALVVGLFARLLCSPPLRWTGRRAFSIYLVHEPIVVALAFALGGRPAPLPFVALATALSLAAAALFFALLETPSHRLARGWAARCAGAGAAGMTPAGAPVAVALGEERLALP